MAVTNLQYSQIVCHNRRQQLFIQIYRMIFYADYVKRAKLLAKKLKFKRQFAFSCHSSEALFPVSKAHTVSLAIDTLKCLMPK